MDYTNNLEAVGGGGLCMFLVPAPIAQESAAQAGDAKPPSTRAGSPAAGTRSNDHRKDTSMKTTHRQNLIAAAHVQTQNIGARRIDYDTT